MKRSSCLPIPTSEALSLPLKGESLLPGGPRAQNQKIKMRSLLGHCLYRRVIVWTIAVVLILGVILSTRVPNKRERILALVQAHRGGHQEVEEPPIWMQYTHLDGYFNGLKALTSFANHQPEFPRPLSETEEEANAPIVVTINAKVPTPTPYVPQPDYYSEEYTSKYHPVRPCYLDQDKTIPVPHLWAFDGIPQGQPKPAVGSHSLLGLREDVCFDRFGRYGPYGLGYSQEEGGTGEGLDTEKSGSDAVWSKTGKIDYRKVDWGQAQDQCFEDNHARFYTADELDELEQSRYSSDNSRRSGHSDGVHSDKQKLGRIAIVIRTYVGFEWTQHVILNFRAMIAELTLQSGGEYALHFLLHVKDENAPIWADAEVIQQILDDNVPVEFQGMCTLWSESQMRLVYPGHFGDAFENMSGADIHGVYRSAHMPLQYFAMMHPEYAHFWNWEMDMRYLGSYYEFFDRLGSWAAKQSRVQLWERSARYYIPELHGNWDNFTDLVQSDIKDAGIRPVMGPAIFEGRQSLRTEENGQSFLPPTCEHDFDTSACGVGEDADLITLNPLFDADNSGWIFSKDVTGYDLGLGVPPRRCAIVTASRLSRRLLEAMHEETWRQHHSMFSEMFPPSMALHHGMKAVFAPHPVYLDRHWDLEEVDKALNGGTAHSSSGPGSPFDLKNEHNFKGATWYYNSEFAGLLWRRWLGYAQKDGRPDVSGEPSEGMLRGGLEEEELKDGSGRLCMRSTLVHPIKWEKPVEPVEPVE